MVNYVFYVQRSFWSIHVYGLPKHSISSFFNVQPVNECKDFILYLKKKEMKETLIIHSFLEKEVIISNKYGI